VDETQLCAVFDMKRVTYFVPRQLNLSRACLVDIELELLLCVGRKPLKPVFVILLVEAAHPFPLLMAV
jgi:hypothetical protein